MNAAPQPVDLTAVALDEIRDPATAAAVSALMQEVRALRGRAGEAPIVPVSPVSPQAAATTARRAIRSPSATDVAVRSAKQVAGCPPVVLRMMSTGPCSLETLAMGTDYSSNIVLGAIERLCAGGYAERATSLSAQRWRLTQKGWQAAMKTGALS